nr:afadin- and alpha-actinin-binding protein isoform X2 [Tanacetum cinerariifolium]
MGQLQDAEKEAEVTSESTEREHEFVAQLVEARNMIDECIKKIRMANDTSLDFSDWMQNKFQQIMCS